MQRSTPPAKTVFVKTYGCQMNVYDSTRMEELLSAEGYDVTAAPENADLIILNTCHIREKAVEKVYSELGKYRVMKDARAAKGKSTRIAVAGCVAQAEGVELAKREPSVDLVFGPQTYHRLPELLAARAATGQTVIETEFPADEKFNGLTPRKPLGKGVAAFLTVQEGCDKFCTFCVVPYTRGAEFSRPVGQIVNEAEDLARQGVREVTLLGQNVNAYRGREADGTSATLAKLVTALSSISGIERIRYMTSHPRDMSDDLIAAHADNGKLMPFLHLPIQAGSDRILKAMNRGHRADDYVKLIARIRTARPDMALSGDFIVGFPGETEADFQATLDVVGEVRYASGYSFKYSPRPGTPAAEHAGQVADEVAAERLQRLQVLLNQQMKDFNAACVGRTLPVLVEKPGRHAGQVIGRSPYLQSVHFDAGAAQAGAIVDVTISDIKPNSLAGHIRRVAA